MSAVAIKTEDLSKRYTLGLYGGHGYSTLRERVVEVSKNSLRRATFRGAPRQPEHVLWALKDLSLTINSGEVVGLIGHNGAGKTTLLKIISRITEPTGGYADVTGRVGSLLEVGTGFHPELTGRENIYLNGAILGMRRSEIRRRFDAIVEFSEMERFLDTPVKRYSSGEAVRLAFAVAAHLEPEILLVDEVLAVGDAAFQRKSLGKMGEVAKEGRTVIFVSHNLAIIQALCQRAVLLEHGQVQADGPVGETIESYLRKLERAASSDLLSRSDRDSSSYGETLIRQIEIDQVGGAPDVVIGGRPATIVVHVTEVLPMMECQLTIVNSLGHAVMTLDSEVSAPSDVRDPDQGARIECSLESMPLVAGRYRIDVSIKGKRMLQDGLQAAAFFDVEPGVQGDRPMPATAVEGDVVLPHLWRLPS
jgi:lipopolysaccharide transport system ATP-binding protein